ncbi:MAG TPA: mechanosensitive ion channel domain-containing protein [Polyangiaceae bacterium]|nr:mechanosensitive ion channel domain-containing protein [Polyangiaceae bacterium]
MRASTLRLLKVAALACSLLGVACATEKASGPAASGAASEGDSQPASSAKPAPAKADTKNEPRPEDALKSSADLVTRGRAALRDFQSISARATVPRELEQAAARLPARRALLASRVAVATDGIRRSRRAAWVRDIRYSFVEDMRQIDALQAQVDDLSKRVASDRKRADELLAFWLRVKELAAAAEVPLEIRQQIDDVIKEGQRAELALARPDAIIIPLQSTLAEMRELSESVLRTAERDGPDLQKDATEHDFSIWRALRDVTKVADPLGTALGTSRHLLHTGAIFIDQNGQQLVMHGIFGVIVLLGLVSLRSRASAWVGDEHEGRIARHTVAHPVAAALLVSMVATSLFYKAAPTAAVLAVYALAMASALVLFPRWLEPRLRRIGYLLGGFMLLDTLRLFFIQVAPLERIVLTLELLMTSLMLGATLRRWRWQASPFSEHWGRFYRGVAWVWLFGAGIGLLGAVFGYGSVAEILGGGVLVSMYLGLIVTAALKAVGGMVWILTQSVLLQRVNFIRNYRARVVSVVIRALRWGALLFWANLSLRFLTLEDSVKQTLSAVLSASLEVGALKVSIGDLAILVLGGALAYYTARFIRFLLEQDVLPRLELTEGNRQVASSSVYYVALLLGFFLTLAAAGIHFDRLTVLAGALGVGIGFGLQDLVQNFVAGLILMFGGPLKVRDKIQVGDLMGEVRTIGFRASTVRTNQGAEVIVPNSKLIADQVINWTLSDQTRRIEIDVGVEYGIDPEQVLSLLREVGRSHPKVLSEPPPNALFLRHGDSSLDFQMLAWVSFDDFASVRSELTVLVNRRFSEQKIGMPFPQREVNLMAISPQVKEALRTLQEKPEQT